MTLVVVGSVTGSPGATSLAIGLAAAWPDAARRRVVVEADPDGGRLGAELGVGVEPGLMALALAARTSTGLTADDLVERGAAAVADWSVIPAPASPEQAHSALVHAAGSLAAVMAGDPLGPVWIVDAGRLSTRSPALPFAVAADHVIVVTAGVVPGAAAGAAPRRGVAQRRLRRVRRRRPADVVADRRDRPVRRCRRRRRAATCVARGDGPAAMRSSAWRPWWHRVEQAAAYLEVEAVVRQ